MRNLAAFAGISVLMLIGTQASACSYTSPAVIGGPTYKTEAERERAMQKALTQEWRQRIRARRAAAEEALARGVDAPAELAEMLIPNVRPIPLRNSTCGPTNEVDVADGEETFADTLAGTAVAAQADNFAAVQRAWHGEIGFGPVCNAEFRGRFAMDLRRRLTPEQLRRAYLFLAARSRTPERDHPSRALRRLIAFEGSTRRPPVRWFTEDRVQEKDIARWIATDKTGRALWAAMDAFWREQAGQLANTQQICPDAVERWPAIRAPLVAALEKAIEDRRRAREAAGRR
jgi:hypothetical protein